MLSLPAFSHLCAGTPGGEFAELSPCATHLTEYEHQLPVGCVRTHMDIIRYVNLDTWGLTEKEVSALDKRKRASHSQSKKTVQSSFSIPKYPIWGRMPCSSTMVTPNHHSLILVDLLCVGDHMI